MASQDAAVRRALSRGVNREAMVAGVLAGAGEPAYGPIMQGHWAYSAAGELPYDPTQAGKELDAAGWTLHGKTRERNGRKAGFTLFYPTGDSVRKELALAFSSDMARIGVDVKLEGRSFDDIKTRQDQGATVFGYGVPYDPDIELYALFHSKFATGDDDAFTNYPRMRVPAIDADLDKERSTLDQSTRSAILEDLQHQLKRDMSWIYLTRLRHIVVASDRVQGIDPITEPHAHGFSRGTSWNLEDWTLKPKG